MVEKIFFNNWVWVWSVCCCCSLETQRLIQQLCSLFRSRNLFESIALEYSAPCLSAMSAWLLMFSRSLSCWKMKCLPYFSWLVNWIRSSSNIIRYSVICRLALTFWNLLGPATEELPQLFFHTHAPTLPSVYGAMMRLGLHRSAWKVFRPSQRFYIFYVWCSLPCTHNAWNRNSILWVQIAPFDYFRGLLHISIITPV